MGIIYNKINKYFIMKSCAIIALIANTSAIQLTREPLVSNMKEGGLEVHQRPAYADYGIDYFVPDFGKSHEIMYTQDNIAQAEAKLGHQLNTNWKHDASPVNPRNYFVPDFGVDEDIIGVNNAVSWSQKDLGHKWTPT